MSVGIAIRQSLLKLKLKQDIFTEMFDILEHNIMKKDKFSKYFEDMLKHR